MGENFVSQKINRTTYDVYSKMRGFYGVMSGSKIEEIITALTNSGIKFDDSDKSRGFIKVPVIQS